MAGVWWVHAHERKGECMHTSVGAKDAVVPLVPGGDAGLAHLSDRDRITGPPSRREGAVSRLAATVASSSGHCKATSLVSAATAGIEVSLA